MKLVTNRSAFAFFQTSFKGAAQLFSSAPVLMIGGATFPRHRAWGAATVFLPNGYRAENYSGKCSSCGVASQPFPVVIRT